MTMSWYQHSRTLTVATMALIAIATALGSTVSQAAHDPAEHIRDVLLQSAKAFASGDMAGLEKTWANDDAVTGFESGHANYGWADYRDNHLGPEMKEMKNTKYTLSDIRVKVSGNTAWATFKYAISADVGNRHVEGGGLGTAVLEKRGQDWKIVHWHSSAPRRPATPAASPAKSPGV